MRALIEQVKIRAVEYSIAALGAVVVSALAVIERYLVDWLAPVPGLWQVRFMIALVAAIFLLIFLIEWHRPRLRFDDATGTWIDRKTAIRYCAACRATKTLARNEARGWRCMVCRQFFGDPERKPEPKLPTDLGPQGWMR